MNIQINVTNKRAVVVGTPVIVCENSDYTVAFAFDAEWAGRDTKTARFVYVQDGAVKYTDVVFIGNTVDVPTLTNIREVRVGVFSGDLCTTTPATIPCELSIRCGTGAPIDPTPSQYDQIMALLGSGALKGDKGEKGDQGERGIQGEPGYTPRRGVDYWTTEDVAEIHGYTDAAIHMSGKIIADAVSTSVPSRPYQVGGVSYTIVDGEAVIGEINGGTNNAGWHAGSGDWIIPDYIRTPDGALYPVTTIADDACAYSTSIAGSDGMYPSARIYIPSTMNTIMSRAFNQGSEHGSLTFIINKEPGAFGDPAGWDNAGSQIIYSGDPFVWDTYYTKSEIDPRIEGNWRKITEMTLAEAAVVSVTADAENQPFSLKRFTITVTKPGVAEDTASGYLWLKSTFNNLPKPVVQSNTHSGTLGVKYRICGDMAAHWETDISSSGAQEPSDNTTAQVYRYPLGTRPEVYALGREPITNFILTWGYSDALPAGTSIEIWGMDA